MKQHIDYMVSFILILLLIITGITGYIQSELELRKFVLHRYFAYSTLIFGFIHLIFKWRRLLSYFRSF
ncbi:MAG: hypothetical protein Q8N12_01065 [Thermodesulfovibrionales bacterium]|nr:hypothetical protein [Thermodesulfovibrionales bacterium]